MDADACAFRRRQVAGWHPFEALASGWANVVTVEHAVMQMVGLAAMDSTADSCSAAAIERTASAAVASKVIEVLAVPSLLADYAAFGSCLSPQNIQLN